MLLVFSKFASKSGIENNASKMEYNAQI